MAAEFEFDNVRVAGLTGAVPSFVQRIVADGVDAARVRRFIKQTGIRQRHISLTEQTSTDLGYGAAVAALENAHWDAGSIDALVFLAQTQDFTNGTGNALIMHGRLGLPHNAVAIDVIQGCASFTYGLATCASLLQQKRIKRCLMLSGDVFWPGYRDRDDILADNEFIFGEGATALLLEKSPDSHPMSIALFSDGAGYCNLFNPFGGVRNAWRLDKTAVLPDGTELRCQYDGKRQSRRNVYMDGLGITQFSTISVVDDMREFLTERGKVANDYDGLLLHQGNLQIVKTIARRLQMPMEKVPIIIDRYANASGGSLSMTLCEAYAGDRRPQLHLLASAFGIGLSWGIVDMVVEPSVIAPIFSYDGRCDEMMAK